MGEAEIRARQIEGLSIQRRSVRERLFRCKDLFGQMLLTGKLKALDREIEALSHPSPTGRAAGGEGEMK